MKTAFQYRRALLSLSADALEDFVRDWTEAIEGKYFRTIRLSGTGDGGRDVVGFVSSALFDGDWHNYQCKQYAQGISESAALLELGKVLYKCHVEQIRPPSEFTFVAPRGASTRLRELLLTPSKLKARLTASWQSVCATKIAKGDTIALDEALLATVDSFDFERVQLLNSDGLLNEPYAIKVLVEWFGADPGTPPVEELVVPAEVQEHELPYVGQLVRAYAESDGAAYNSHAELPETSTHVQHLARQRERFYSTETFKRCYRDNTPPGVLESVEDDVFNGVVDTCGRSHTNALARVEAVLEQAARISISGVLVPHAKVKVRQGYCHHFANVGRLRWIP